MSEQRVSDEMVREHLAILQGTPNRIQGILPGSLPHEDALLDLLAAREEIERLWQAVGLATTLAGDVVMDVDNPLDMMEVIVAKVIAAREKAERERDEARSALLWYVRKVGVRIALWCGLPPESVIRATSDAVSARAAEEAHDGE